MQTTCLHNARVMLNACFCCKQTSSPRSSRVKIAVNGHTFNRSTLLCNHRCRNAPSFIDTQVINKRRASASSLSASSASFAFAFTFASNRFAIGSGVFCLDLTCLQFQKLLFLLASAASTAARGFLSCKSEVAASVDGNSKPWSTFKPSTSDFTKRRMEKP